MFRMVKTVAMSRKMSEIKYGPFRSVCLYFLMVGCWPLSLPFATLTDGIAIVSVDVCDGLTREPQHTSAAISNAGDKTQGSRAKRVGKGKGSV